MLTIGVDEAGRGPLIGRVYAGAVIIDKDIDEDINKIITDSKKLSKKKRYMAFYSLKYDIYFYK